MKSFTLESELGHKVRSRFDDLLEGRDQRKCKCVMLNIEIRERVREKKKHIRFWTWP